MEARSEEQKRAVIEKVTAAMVEAVCVDFTEIPKSHGASPARAPRISDANKANLLQLVIPACAGMTGLTFVANQESL
jgi:hypothetical protein